MYNPGEKILQRYADVLVNFALGGGEGVREKEVVYVNISESARPFLEPLMKAILEAKAYPMLGYDPEGYSRTFFEHASDDQLEFFPKDYLLERVNTIDHLIGIHSTDNKYELQGIDSQKIMQRMQSGKFYFDARRRKENEGNLTWTLALYGTKAMAEDVDMTEEEYWEQIIKACFLDHKDPVSRWQDVYQQIEGIQSELDELDMRKLHIKGDDVDLTIEVGEQRKWLGGSGRNIPSFEVFISPDWRGTEGWVRFNQPLYRYGNLITGIELEFEEGRVVQAKAEENEKLLKDMIATEGADKVGEFSLTDKRFSRITKFMGETLYDENVGGENGNFHIALGAAYKESFTGSVKDLSEEEWHELGFNDSAVHTDIISTSDRTVTATSADGSDSVIYRDGEFQLGNTNNE